MGQRFGHRLSMIIKSEAVAVTSMTFKYFADHIIKKLQTPSVKDDVQRLDIVLDTYDTFIVKSVTKGERGVGSRVLFEYNDPLPDDFSSFLKNDDNKLTIINLFHSLL